MKLFSIVLLSLALVLESSVTTIPLVFLSLVSLMVIKKENWIFLYGFLFGALLDLFSFRILGISSAFFVTFLFLILLYQRKFEIATNYFVLGACFIGSFSFLLLLGFNNLIIVESLVSALIGLLLFIMFKRFVELDLVSSKNL